MDETWNRQKLPLESFSIEEVAQQLQVHPSEVIRLLVQLKAFPANLLIDPGFVETLRKASGIENWWVKEDRNTVERSGISLVQRCLQHMLEKRCVEPECTRADNLFRGLPDATAVWLRRVANTLIREGILFTRMSHLGLMVGIRAPHLAEIQEFVVHGRGPLHDLCNVG